MPASDLEDPITVPGLVLLGRILPPVQTKPSVTGAFVVKMYEPKNIVVSLETPVEGLWGYRGVLDRQKWLARK